MAPRRILLVHGKAEASFAHSKRFAQYDIAVHVGPSRCDGASEPRGSVWSARSLLPLWLVPRQHALWNRQDWKAGKLFCCRSNANGPGGGPISAPSKLRCSHWGLAASYLNILPRHGQSATALDELEPKEPNDDPLSPLRCPLATPHQPP